MLLQARWLLGHGAYGRQTGTESARPTHPSSLQLAHSLVLGVGHGVQEGGECLVGGPHGRVGMRVLVPPIHEQHRVQLKGMRLHLCAMSMHGQHTHTRRPLCHMQITQGHDSWVSHTWLLGRSTCAPFRMN